MTFTIFYSWLAHSLSIIFGAQFVLNFCVIGREVLSNDSLNKQIHTIFPPRSAIHFLLCYQMHQYILGITICIIDERNTFFFNSLPLLIPAFDILNTTTISSLAMPKASMVSKYHTQNNTENTLVGSFVHWCFIL